ncbi:MAG: peptidoglycan editing factor PgeF [Pseudomonadota bacterium]
MPDPYISDSLGPVRHGFFTRAGGVSGGIYEGLNCGPGSNDDPGHVSENRARVARWFDAEPDRLVTLWQVHSADAVTVTEPFAQRPKADALVTATPGLVLGILTADCAPVLFADVEAGVVGAAHAGWKGALGGVVEATVAAMVLLGAARERIRATVGPTIAQASYEVGEDFMDRFLDEDPGFQQFFAGGAPGKAQFDLPGFVLHRCREAGVAADWIGRDTYAEPVRFFSYRRATHRGEGDYGRLISAIRV